ncbi:MAG: type I-G CRISPR-associated helicase/endonuclease Cas3g [Acidimicrobiales bacterium]
MGTHVEFEQFMEAATGRQPYPYQARLARDGLPEILDVETGAGKTAGIVLSWLWRRTGCPDPDVRNATPHWLVLCAPLRTLTEQTHKNVTEWVERLVERGVLRDGEVGVHFAMGGSENQAQQKVWRRNPEGCAIVIGTMDMLLSRALNRGYAMSRFNWPIDFGLFNNGVHWVFDEVQLMGPGAATSRQLEGLRRRFGTVIPCSSTWMSATVDKASLSTIDCPDIGPTVELRPEDRSDPELSKRLNALRTINCLEIPAGGDRASRLAAALAKYHRQGTRTLAVLNTVSGAQALYREVTKILPEVKTVLLHSRYRPVERFEHLKRALEEPDCSSPGTVVVATQVVEAGVDFSATTLLTEAAPWASIVQRAGRCNRDGDAERALMLWTPVKDKDLGPYMEADVARAAEVLRSLDGSEVSPATLREQRVPSERIVQPVLRAIDLLGLFDTAPDVSGNDVDIAPFIRGTDESNVFIAWRDLNGGAPDDQSKAPSSTELCPAPLGRELSEFVNRMWVWRYDFIDRCWVRAKKADLRPGVVLIAGLEAGGYDQELGWLPKSKHRVDATEGEGGDPGSVLVEAEEPFADDHLTQVAGEWVRLQEHLADVEHAVREMSRGFGGETIPNDLLKAAALAGRYHDIGKAHAVFQNSLLKLASDSQKNWLEARGPWAKSGEKNKQLRHERKFFRHELVSALVLVDAEGGVLSGTAEPDLVTYLVAAHHGRVRLGIRAAPGEDGDSTVLGVKEGDVVPEVEVPEGSRIPPSSLSLGTIHLGRSTDGTPSWSERMLALRDRSDLGPFRLGFLEALVRLADWRASSQHGSEVSR